MKYISERQSGRYRHEELKAERRERETEGSTREDLQEAIPPVVGETCKSDCGLAVCECERRETRNRFPSPRHFITHLASLPFASFPFASLPFASCPNPSVLSPPRRSGVQEGNDDIDFEVEFGSGRTRGPHGARFEGALEFFVGGVRVTTLGSDSDEAGETNIVEVDDDSNLEMDAGHHRLEEKSICLEEFLLAEETIEGHAIFDELHGSLSTQQGEIALFARELRKVFTEYLTKCVVNRVRYAKILEDFKNDLESHGGPPDCIVSENFSSSIYLLLCRIRELVLREVGFKDIFKNVAEDNAKAITLFKDVFRLNDTTEEEPKRVENLVRGKFAENLFDLGSGILHKYANAPVKI
ncbi:hypothetical protein Ccrd_025640 [Cynara cardunculus var. scolymus]|uniref:Damage-control phosphatase ARMT1-like metal-binding domain-containing protein n=1 Tax=Cynara cardunculus var. scolymus TaxID=59895 RepID=A0A103W1Z2_CYNCS|nr:hypothetical protein Ccrd_025640 [Cynara cardunculus var. scolymus]